MGVYLQPPSASNWAEHRFRASLFWLTLAAGQLAFVAVTLKHDWLLRLGLAGLGWAGLAWLLGVLAAGLYWQRFQCPRCDKTFYRQSPPLLPLRADSCRACRLPRHH